MSRVGKKPLVIPEKIDLKVEDRMVKVKGPKGELSLALHPHVDMKIEGKDVTFDVKNPENVKDKALWGLFRRLVGNMITGVTEGFEKKLVINGVGYRASATGNILKLEVGYSHDVNFEIPDGITAEVEKNVVTIKGIDKQAVGEVAAQIRRIRKPEPYKGKGIKYSDETIRRKAGKAAKSGA